MARPEAKTRKELEAELAWIRRKMEEATNGEIQYFKNEEAKILKRLERMP